MNSLRDDLTDAAELSSYVIRAGDAIRRHVTRPLAMPLPRKLDDFGPVAKYTCGYAKSHYAMPDFFFNTLHIIMYVNT